MADGTVAKPTTAQGEESLSAQYPTLYAAAGGLSVDELGAASDPAAPIKGGTKGALIERHLVVLLYHGHRDVAAIAKTTAHPSWEGLVGGASEAEADVELAQFAAYAEKTYPDYLLGRTAGTVDASVADTNEVDLTSPVLSPDDDDTATAVVLQKPADVEDPDQEPEPPISSRCPTLFAAFRKMTPEQLAKAADQQSPVHGISKDALIESYILTLIARGHRDVDSIKKKSKLPASGRVRLGDAEANANAELDLFETYAAQTYPEYIEDSSEVAARFPVLFTAFSQMSIEQLDRALDEDCPVTGFSKHALIESYLVTLIRRKHNNITSVADKSKITPSGRAMLKKDPASVKAELKAFELYAAATYPSYIDDQSLDAGSSNSPTSVAEQEWSASPAWSRHSVRSRSSVKSKSVKSKPALGSFDEEDGEPPIATQCPRLFSAFREMSAKQLSQIAQTPAAAGATKDALIEQGLVSLMRQGHRDVKSIVQKSKLVAAGRVKLHDDTATAAAEIKTFEAYMAKAHPVDVESSPAAERFPVLFDAFHEMTVEQLRRAIDDASPIAGATHDALIESYLVTLMKRGHCDLTAITDRSKLVVAGRTKLRDQSEVATGEIRQFEAYASKLYPDYVGQSRDQTKMSVAECCPVLFDAFRKMSMDGLTAAADVECPVKGGTKDDLIEAVVLTKMHAGLYDVTAFLNKGELAPKVFAVVKHSLSEAEAELAFFQTYANKAYPRYLDEAVGSPHKPAFGSSNRLSLV
jgi:hypothetical protein